MRIEREEVDGDADYVHITSKLTAESLKQLRREIDLMIAHADPTDPDHPEGNC